MQRRLLNDRYELLNNLGQGGMATVYRGMDTRLGRPVAIKLLHAQYANDDEFRRRFEHEAQAAAGLSAHPNIVDVYDVGQQDGQPYIVMELVEGPDLKTLIENEGPLSVERTLGIAQQVAEALEYAHSKGFVHRDVKPQNIMIGQDGMARITDFGIAKSNLSTAVTQAGITYGTADYISPEQAQGLAATPRSDVYSLGIAVYEMLTQHLPFTGDSPMAVAVQHIQQAPPPLRQWIPTIPQSLERIVLGSIAKDPRERPASARAFATALREYRTSRVQDTMAAPAVPNINAAPTQAVVVPRAPQQPARNATAPMQTPPRSQTQPQRAPRPMPVPAPPPLRRPERAESSGAGAFIIGLLLLAGLLGLAYVTFATDTFSNVFAPSPTTVAAPTTGPTATAAPTSTPVVLVQLPPFVGQQEIAVRQQITDLGLVLGIIGPPVPNEAPAGTVIDQDPDPGQTVNRGSEVKIQMSLGPEATPTAEAAPTPEVAPTDAPPPTPVVLSIPNLTNTPFSAASAALTAAGFNVQRQDQPSTSVPEGVIISQAPPPGELERGSTITLLVSLGDMVAFPAVIGSQRAEAEQLLRATDGVTLQTVDLQGPDVLSNYDQFQPNQVVSATADGKPVQNGAFVRRGAQIILGVRAP